MNEYVTSILCALLGAVVGGGITYFTEWRLRKNDDKQRKEHVSSLLYNDLKSIENYLKKERGPVNIRYSTEWQGMLAQCYFLESEDIEYIYKIYDKVYNYNFHYSPTRLKEEIIEYENLRELFFDNSKGYIDDKLLNLKYSQILDKLKVKRK